VLRRGYDFSDGFVNDVRDELIVGLIVEREDGLEEVNFMNAGGESCANKAE